MTSEAKDLKRNVNKIELSGGARRALREFRETGWSDPNAYPLETAELERAGFVYDGAVTGAGYLRD